MKTNETKTKISMENSEKDFYFSRNEENYELKILKDSNFNNFNRNEREEKNNFKEKLFEKDNEIKQMKIFMKSKENICIENEKKLEDLLIENEKLTKINEDNYKKINVFIMYFIFIYFYLIGI